VLRRTDGNKTEEVTGGRRELDSQEFHNLYSSPHYSGGQIKEDKMCED